ncbi:hypothetical protein AFLA_008264 [Aspergillus flavus NRRL3357]|nr:hypothetical protein AFLA_008264 [Aspergillus flavus NRRL3357]
MPPYTGPWLGGWDGPGLSGGTQLPDNKSFLILKFDSLIGGRWHLAFINRVTTPFLCLVFSWEITINIYDLFQCLEFPA